MSEWLQKRIEENYSKRENKLYEALEAVLYMIIRLQVIEEEMELTKHVEFLKQAVAEAAGRARPLRAELAASAAAADGAAEQLRAAMRDNSPDKVTT